MPGSGQTNQGTTLPHQTSSCDLDIFRNRWIENIDKNFSQNVPESNLLQQLTDSINACDDREVAKIKTEFDRLQKKLAYFEKESRKEEFFQFFPTKTCTSDQLIFVRNHRLVTSLNDIEILFLGDSDEESIYTDMPSGTMSHLRYSVGPFINDSCKSVRPSLLFKVKRYFSCW